MKFENMKVWFSIPKDERYSFYLNEFMKNLQFFFLERPLNLLRKANGKTVSIPCYGLRNIQFKISNQKNLETPSTWVPCLTF